MSKLTKRQQAIAEKIKTDAIYSPKDGVAALQSLPAVKFNESVDISVNLGVDPRKSDQVVRGSIVLPKGTGKTVRVAVFTGEANQEAAKAAGADIVGLEDLADKVKSGEMDFDIVIATPDAMRVVGGLGQILGPRGMMPNPKDGTVTPDVTAAVNNAKAGQVRYRTDKNGIIHCAIGKLSFDSEDLLENLGALVAALRKSRPSSAKGAFIKKVTLSSTMGPGLRIDPSAIEANADL